MDNKHNFMGIILPVVIAIILLSVLPILINPSSSGIISSDDISSEDISSEDISSEDISSEDVSSEPALVYPTNVVVFKSDSPRTITPKYTNTGITLQYSIDYGSTWTNISSGVTTASSDEIWFRGQAIETKSLFTSDNNTNAWSFGGDGINKLKVYGNLNFLLCDNLGDEVAPTSLASDCYSYMFYGCTSLTTPPELPATTLAIDCYYSMFRDCTSLTTVPELPATTLATDCYNSMFRDCTSLKVSASKTGSYQYSWQIPTSGTGTTATGWNSSMLSNTGGTFTSGPTINTIYYVENPPV